MVQADNWIYWVLVSLNYKLLQHYNNMVVLHSVFKCFHGVIKQAGLKFGVRNQLSNLILNIQRYWKNKMKIQLCVWIISGNGKILSRVGMTIGGVWIGY
jgi:hypothetical protein